MIKKLLFFFALSCCFFGFSQEKTIDPDRKFGFAFSPGVAIQRNVFVEANLFAGLIVSHVDGEKIPQVGNLGFRIGVESDCNRIIAPKIGCEIAATICTIRLSGVQYFQDGNSEFRLIPEFGYCIGGWVNLTYGYGISFKTHTGLTDIGRHRVCLSFNLNRRLGKAARSLL
jgi:hypothetical protein